MIHLAKVFFLNADFYVVTWYRWELVHTFLTSDKDDLFQVSYLGTVHLEVIAKRLSLPDNLVRGGTFPFYLCMGRGGEVSTDLSSTGGTCSIGSGKAVALQSRGEDVVHLKF